MAKELWMQKVFKKSHKGRLRRNLGLKKGQKLTKRRVRQIIDTKVGNKIRVNGGKTKRLSLTVKQQANAALRGMEAKH